MMQMACSCRHTNEAMYTSARRLYPFESDNVSKHPRVVGHVHEHVVISQHTSCNISKAGGHQLMPLKHGFQQKGFITWKPFDILGKNLGKL